MIAEERLAQRTRQFVKALKRLQDACSRDEDEFMRDAVIQRFEFCFELAWKMLKLKLEEEGVVAGTPRQVIREAVAAGYLGDGNLWTELLRMRNETSHAYDEEMAIRVYRFVCDTGLPLFEALAGMAERW